MDLNLNSIGKSLKKTFDLRNTQKSKVNLVWKTQLKFLLFQNND